MAAASDSAEGHAAQAQASWRRSELDDALAHIGRCLALRPGFPPALALRGFCEGARAEFPACQQSFRQAGLPEADPRLVEFVFQELVEAVRSSRRIFAGAEAPAGDPGSISLTIVTCSRDGEKLSRCRAALERVIPGGFEFLGFRSPRSLAGAYGEALAQARGDAIVFLHDDVEILTPRLDRLVARALAQADVVGIAGTRELAGPTLGWAGQSPMAGWLVHGSADSGTWDFSLLALRGGLVAGMQGLDGCFLAARTSSARQVGFDAATFDAFHFYDLDFCLRAQRAGLAVAVDTGILLAHASRGKLGFAWEEQARRFRAKFAPIGGEPARPSHFHAARLANADQALRLHAELNGFCTAIGTREG